MSIELVGVRVEVAGSHRVLIEALSPGDSTVYSLRVEVTGEAPLRMNDSEIAALGPDGIVDTILRLVGRAIPGPARLELTGHVVAVLAAVVPRTPYGRR